MTRVKRGVISTKSRRYLLKKVKGFRFGRSTKERQAREALFHAGNHAFAHRRDKKNDFRRLWNIKINAAVRPLGFSYSRFIDTLNKKGVSLDRKVLAHLAEHDSAVLERIAKELK